MPSKIRKYSVTAFLTKWLTELSRVVIWELMNASGFKPNQNYNITMVTLI